MFMQSDNIFIAKGRLATNPVVNISGTGNVITTVKLAQKTPFRTDNNEFKTVLVEYVAIDTKNNKLGTRLAEYTTKGTLITLEGYHDSYSKENNSGSEEFYQVNRITAFRNEEGKEKTLQRRHNQR
ncbi:single-stranded DNA-binding protein [Bacillus thuringiensis]|uniref:single-stranded DNA-binding protein n=1 Tax=Bacillus thuringiensis TaxID=1428 RepID=UPI000BFD026A|nr:single-stranded DNA-binding protein [Bacillus thuringiensis]PGU98939.1 hypothetical protein COD69_13445 [Bacillus thuringiensis]